MLQADIGLIGASTWELLGRGLLKAAREAGVETGAAVRIDSTVTETHTLSPSDSRLLYEGVRVLTRLLRRAREKFSAGGGPVPRSSPTVARDRGPLLPTCGTSAPGCRPVSLPAPVQTDSPH